MGCGNIGSDSNLSILQQKEVELAHNKKIPSSTILEPEIIVKNSEYLEEDLFTLWDKFFERFVVITSETPFDTRVDYEKMHLLRKNRDMDFLSLVSSIEEKISNYDIETAPTHVKKSFYINLYNYAGVRLINKGYIEDNKTISSIKDLSEEVYPYEIFSRKSIPLKIGDVSLDDILKKKLKPLFSFDGKVTDSRFILALNGGVLGRSFLSPNAFRPESFEGQLEEAVQKGFKLKRIAHINEKTLTVSRMFKWYKQYIEESSDSLESFIEKSGIPKSDYRLILYSDFNWSINGVKTVVEKEETSSIRENASNNRRDPRDLFNRFGETDNQRMPNLPQGELVKLGDDCEFLNSDTVKVLAFCSEVVKGRIRGFFTYKNKIVGSSLCLYQRKLTNNELSLGVFGNVTEIPRDRPQVNVTLDIEGEVSHHRNIIRMKKTDNLTTTLEYHKRNQTLLIRQTPQFFGEGLRKFKLQCQSI